MEISVKTKTRCSWPGDNLLMIAYHDEEWGRPEHDDRALFEFLILEGAQAGLSWQTVLKKRQNYRKAFDGFDAHKIARYGAKDVKRLLADSGIIRNRLKIAATIQNAKAFLAIQKEFASFAAYIWKFAGGRPINHRIKTMKDIPARTMESDAMSKGLLKWGFKFVGSTICYAFMQAVGLVNDHETKCFRYKDLADFRAEKS
jgi:DNA-3-methyladenine glycosylase I